MAALPVLRGHAGQGRAAAHRAAEGRQAGRVDGQVMPAVDGRGEVYSPAARARQGGIAAQDHGIVIGLSAAGGEVAVDDRPSRSIRDEIAHIREHRRQRHRAGEVQRQVMVLGVETRPQRERRAGQDGVIAQRHRVVIGLRARGRDQCACPNDTIVANLAVVEQNAAHSDECTVAYCRAVNDRAMTNDDIFADDGIRQIGCHVDARQILNMLRAPILMAPTSPRSTAPYQMLAPGPISTSPMMDAFSAINTPEAILGSLPAKLRIIGILGIFLVCVRRTWGTGPCARHCAVSSEFWNETTLRLRFPFHRVPLFQPPCQALEGY